MEEEDKSIEALQKLLQKAVSGDELLLKAKKKDEEEEEEKEDEYGEKFMKKMKSYMKTHKKYMKDDDDDMKKMKKALEAEQNDLSGEILEADATIVDGTKMFQKFVDFADSMMKAMSNVGTRLESLEDQLEYNGELAKASGSVLVKTASLMDSVSSTPNPVKGMAAGFIQETQPKAGDVNLQKAVILEKAGKLGISGIKGLLLKAMLSGNAEAGKVLTTIECCHGNLHLMPDSGMKVIATLLPNQ